ncbi:MAG: C1 family peptidase [Bacteroidota bacterium]
MKKITLSILIAFCAVIVSAQDTSKKDKAIFKEYKAGYYQNSILKGIEDFETKEETPAVTKRFKIDFTGMDIPTSVDQFTKFWCQPPISQGNTGTCWCFSTISYFETEVYRLYKKEVKLSEMYTVYWEYVEKAIQYVEKKGDSYFAEGSEGNAVTRIWKKYGVIPAADYTGMKTGQTFHNHEDMYNEMNTYLKSVKEACAWNKDEVVTTIKSIMDSYMGEPPAKVIIDGKEMTPQEYLKNVLKLDLNDYIDVMSFMSNDYYSKCEYDVPDNWWDCADYYNVSLDDYMSILKYAIKNGYTIAVGGDVSEAGFESYAQTAVVPTFDIPSEYIDENARQFRFSNETSTDDHGLHIIGYYEKDGTTWFLVKDSGAGSRNAGKDSKNFGYYFFHEDFVKLKMLDFMVHKDAMKDVLKKFK